MSPSEKRKKLLEAVEACVCQNRMSQYGDAEDNFADIADMVNVIGRRRGWLASGKFISSQDVALVMLAVKMSRIANDPSHLDSWVDAAGYAACGGAINMS